MDKGTGTDSADTDLEENTPFNLHARPPATIVHHGTPIARLAHHAGQCWDCAWSALAALASSPHLMSYTAEADGMHSCSCSICCS